MVNDILLHNANQESASRTRSLETRGPGHGNLGPEPGPIIKSRKDQDSNSKFAGFGTVPGAKKFEDSVPGPENFSGHGPGPVPTTALSMAYWRL